MVVPLLLPSVSSELASARRRRGGCGGNRLEHVRAHVGFDLELVTDHALLLLLVLGAAWLHLAKGFKQRPAALTGAVCAAERLALPALYLSEEGAFDDRAARGDGLKGRVRLLSSGSPDHHEAHEERAVGSSGLCDCRVEVCLRAVVSH